MGEMLTFYAAHAFWVWVALAAALLAVEVATGSGWLLWPAGAAGVVALAGLVLPMPVPVALMLFAALTIATSLLGRRFLPRALLVQGHDINDNVARLIGHHGKAVADFASGQGRVSIDGKEWAAELEAGDTLRSGTDVEVVGVSGATLRVRPSS